MVKKILGIVSVCGLLLGLAPLQVKAAPQVFISGVTDATYYNRNVTILYGTNEGRASATLNNLSFSSGSTISSEGVYSLLVAAIADSGTNSRSLFFGIDKTPPVISIGGVSDGQVTTGSLAPTFSANEGTVSATLNGAPFASGGTVSGVGSYTFRVEAVDKAHNTTVRTLGFRIESPPLPPPEEEEEEEEAPAEEEAGPTVVPAPSPAPAARRVALAKAPAKYLVRRLPAPAIAPEPSIDDLLRMIVIDSILNVDDGSRPLDSCSPIEIQGRAEPNWWLTLFIKEEGSDEVILGVVQIGQDGKWTFRRVQAFAPGTYTFIGQLETTDGKFGPKISLRDFRVAECKKEAPAAKVWNLIWLWWTLAGILLLILILLAIWLLLQRRRRRQLGGRLGEGQGTASRL